jgi:hypothetical protein
MAPSAALVVIDFFAPHLRGPVLEQAAVHRFGVWILKQHVGNPRVARLHAESPKKSRVLHQAGSWETAAWDVESLLFST